MRFKKRNDENFSPTKVGLGIKQKEKMESLSTLAQQPVLYTRHRDEDKLFALFAQQDILFLHEPLHDLGILDLDLSADEVKKVTKAQVHQLSISGERNVFFMSVPQKAGSRLLLRLIHADCTGLLSLSPLINYLKDDAGRPSKQLDKKLLSGSQRGQVFDMVVLTLCLESNIVKGSLFALSEFRVLNIRDQCTCVVSY